MCVGKTHVTVIQTSFYSWKDERIGVRGSYLIMNVKDFSAILRPQNQKMSAEARRKPQKARTSWGFRFEPSTVLKLALTPEHNFSTPENETLTIRLPVLKCCN